MLSTEDIEGKSVPNADKHIETPGAATSAAAAASAPSVPDAAAIASMESLIEANVQSTLDGLDAWTMTAPFLGNAAKSPTACTKAKHTCDFDAEETKLCIGCLLFRRIVKQRSIFPVGGRTDACDFLAAGIAEPLVTAFMKDSAWLNPLAELKGRWFVKHPLTFINKARSTIHPASQVALRRDRARLFDGDALLGQLGLFEQKDKIYTYLHDFWHTKAEGLIYSLDELFEVLGPIIPIAESMNRLGVYDIGRVAPGVASVLSELSK